MAKAIFEVDSVDFESKALAWAQQFEQICYLQSNGYQDEYSSIEAILAVDAAYTFESTNEDTFKRLDNFKTKHPNHWMFGFFGYDLKNEIEDLKTSFPNPLKFPDCYFFVPKTIIKFSINSIEIQSDNPEEDYVAISNFFQNESSQKENFNIEIQHRLGKEGYFKAFERIISHIQRGDIYEVNLCQEFYAEDVDINPLEVYKRLNHLSPTPFSTYFKIKDKYIISASPERFLAKRDDILISQPIKGTAARGNSAIEDQKNIIELRNNPKEIAENVMIVDLVRNDMTRSAKPGTVAAERKLEVHSFKQVHQLISTITCSKSDDISDIEAIKNIFPPGSMTGAPKISAMKLCDTYENSRRGVYSGAVGYFSAEGDFDFNVVIRTILYNQNEKYLSFHTGGAITIDANVDKEYNECLLKASAIIQTLTS
ncbi:anthranilate synthase component I family protein [Sphingobacterium bovistauri]|uniref:Anthranilate synthase component I family protein n=1 Tax=Sphingobacterium bovistauri TaxID=2781959 RepID=A0ABS7Z0V6_9SPHI|nr:anthranilate synthase component I family protein [Sphingobacterium bovistauri]MCA5003603.1 anthranilate synthase component I family protein [Sphingobacterium bovistauri]